MNRRYVKRPLLPALFTIALAILLEKKTGALPLWLFLGPATLIFFRRPRSAGILSLALLFALLPALYLQREKDRRLSTYDGKMADGQFLAESTVSGEGRVTVEARILSCPEEGICGERIRIRLYEEKEILPGDILTGEIVIKRPDGKRNPGGFDDRCHLAAKGIHLCGSLRYGDTLEVRGASLSPFLSVRRFRAERIKKLRERLPENQAQIAAALIFGESPGEEISDLFRSAGLSHLLAVSGLHAGIVAGFFLMLLRPVRKRAGDKLFFLLISAFLISYLLITGLTPSALRAVCMALTVQAGEVFSFTRDSLSSLIACALAFLLRRPYLLFQAGFLLTFAACLGIALFYAPMRKRAGKLKGKVTDAFLAGACACGLSLPAGAVLFPQATLLGLFSGAALTPLTAPLIISAAPAAFLPDTLFSSALATPFSMLCRIFLHVTSFFSARSFPSVSGRRQAVLTLSLSLLALSSLSGYLTGKKRRRACIILLAGIFGFVIIPKGVRVTVLDVGQGSAALVESDGLSLLIDGGGYESYGQEGVKRTPVSEKVLFPALGEKGITSLDAVFISHNHQDHAQGALEVLGAMPARSVYVNPGWNDGETLSRLQVPLVRGVCGLTLRAPSLRITVLSPAPGPELPDSLQNEDSLVLLIESGDLAVLFPGDIGTGTEEKIAQELSRVTAGRRILVAAHHGSAASNGEALLAAYRPDTVIISCGENNRYGHPSEEALSRLRASGAKILRTDRDGAIEIRSGLFGTRVRAYDAVIE